MNRQELLRLPLIGLTLMALLYGACESAPTSIPTTPLSTSAAAPIDKCMDSGYDPMADSDIIIAGWIEGWQGTHYEPTNQLETIHPRIDIRQVFKGQSLPDPLTFTDNSSLIYGPTLQWSGASDSCGTFVFDPTGHYVVLGLSKGEDGNYYSSRPRLFFIGKEPKGEHYLQALSQLDVLAPTVSP